MNYMDCGELGSQKNCVMSNVSTSATTFHCNGVNSRNIRECIFNTGGTTVYVDSGLTSCLGYDSNGYLTTANSPTCRTFRIRCP